MTLEYRHTPVMLKEVIDALNLQSGDCFIDCTLGGAGHSIEAARIIAPDGILVGIDQDDMALKAAGERLLNTQLKRQPLLLKGNFGNLDKLLITAEIPNAQGILFDLGVSSPQLDFPERGFSYKGESRLDMRMDPSTQTLDAAKVIADYSESDLTRILRDYGEERWASRIAQFIVDARDKESIETASQLVELVKAAIPASARRAGGHPAKRTFQALRIEVNQEIKALEYGLEAAIRWLAPRGRIVVMSYHSLEDRIVKEMFSRLSQGCTCPPDLPICVCKNVPVLKLVSKKPLIPDEEELERNPRAKSVKVRIAEKL